MNSTLNFGIPIVFVFLLDVYYKADRLLFGLTAQQKGTTARWYSNKTSLILFLPWALWAGIGGNAVVLWRGTCSGLDVIKIGRCFGVFTPVSPVIIH